MTGPDPRHDAAVRRAVHRALDDVVRAARDVAYRRADETGGYAVPDPVPFGDVTGLIAAGECEVLDRLQATIDAAKAVNAEVRAAVHAYQQATLGEGWQPPPLRRAS